MDCDERWVKGWWWRRRVVDGIRDMYEGDYVGTRGPDNEHGINEDIDQ